MDEPVVKVTLPEIYKDVQATKQSISAMNHKLDKFISLNERLDSHKQDIAGHEARIRKLEIQIAAQWVVVGLVTTGIGAVIGTAFTR